MPRYYGRERDTKTLAIGIKGELSSFCGAIERFEHHGKQWNGLLTLKEQCARRIALIKNEQLKCFITAYLSSDLFKYVTKDIFDLERSEFTSNYAKPLYMCQECTMDSYEKPSDDCQCPKMDAAIDALNNYLSKRMNNENDETETDELKQFELIYKIPNDEMDHSYELKRPTSFFLYLSPTQYQANYMDHEGCMPFDRYHLLDCQISAEDKLLFVDAMRFFGGFRTNYQEPQLILYRRREILL
jgi:hypothetical protein